MNYKKVKFEKELPYTDKHVTGILYSMLEFNPYFRKPASQILKNQVFEYCHKEYPNLAAGNETPKKIKLEYDKKNAYDYNEDKSTYPIESLKDILLNEIKIIHS